MTKQRIYDDNLAFYKKAIDAKINEFININNEYYLAKHKNKNNELTLLELNRIEENRQYCKNEFIEIFNDISKSYVRLKTRKKPFTE